MSLRFGTANTDRVTVAEQAAGALGERNTNLAAFTVAAWVLPTSLPTANSLYTIFHRQITTAVHRSVAMVGGTNKISIKAKRTGVTSDFILETANAVIKIGEWNFVAVGYNATQGWKCWHCLEHSQVKEQVLVDTSTGTGGLTDDTGSTIQWGGVEAAMVGATTGQSFPGLMSAVGMWNRQLPTSELMNLKANFMPTQDAVDFHTFKQAGQIQSQIDLTRKRAGKAGVLSSNAMLQSVTHRLGADPATEIL